MTVVPYSPNRSWLAVVFLVGVVGIDPSVAVAEAGHDHLARLGTVEFKVECSEEAQQEFNRAMALYHSFAWEHAPEAFASVAAADRTCGMAHWGRAMSMLDNPFVWPGNLPPDTLDAVAAALEEARSAGLKTQREKDYVEAVAVFVRDHETVDHRTRVQAFEEALGKVAENNPDDMEAAVLHALVTSANFIPEDKTYANQMRAAEILQPLFEAHPDHPGVAHYIIHTYDYPPLAQKGLKAARLYATIAPDAPHALHMPSHIFTRAGLWQDSIATNEASAKAAGDGSFQGHHASDYMVYAYLQLAQDEAARRATERSMGMKAVDHFAAAYAYAAMPARLALEKDDWATAASIPLTPARDQYAWEKYPQAEAVNAFARGVGAARSGDAAAGRQEQETLLALRDAAKQPYWAGQIEIQAEVVGALALCAEGKSQDCLEALRQAAAREDATEKHVVTPGPILPARELLADMLLEAGQPGDALKEYEAVLLKEPNRYRAVAGAMRAADEAGDGEKARLHAAALLAQAAEEAGDRTSLRTAKELSTN
jgi:hypothetical protein